MGMKWRMLTLPPRTERSCEDGSQRAATSMRLSSYPSTALHYDLLC